MKKLSGAEQLLLAVAGLVMAVVGYIASMSSNSVSAESINSSFDCMKKAEASQFPILARAKCQEKLAPAAANGKALNSILQGPETTKTPPTP